MPYSITTKDGITINNIPDDVDPNSTHLRLRVHRERQKAGLPAPQEDLAAKAEAAGMSMRDGKVNWGAELEKQAIDEQSVPERIFKSLGAGFADIPLALKQAFNRDPKRAKELEREAADKREADKYLAKNTDLGVLPDQLPFLGDTPTLGGFAQGYGKTVPTMAIPAGGALGTAGNIGLSAVSGGLTGFLEPTVEGESRGWNTAKGAAMSSLLPMATAAVRPVYNAVSKTGGQNKAAAEVAKTITEKGADEATVLKQTIDRLRSAQQGDIPLSTAAQLRDPNLARLEVGNRARNGANWYDFDQGQAKAVAGAFDQATQEAADLAARRGTRAANWTKNWDAAQGNLTGEFAKDVPAFRKNIDIALQSPEASNPAVRNMLDAIKGEIDRVGPNFSPAHLQQIRANLSAKFNPMNPNVYAAAPRDSMARTSVLKEVDDILNRATGGKWDDVVSGYAADSRLVDAAKAAGRVRGKYLDDVGATKLGVRSADTLGDVPLITEAGLGRAMNAGRDPAGNMLLSGQANTRLNAILDALRAQGITQGVKRSATAGGGSDTVSNRFAAQAAGHAAEALGASGSMTASAASGALSKLGQLATANKDRALAEALQNPQQMIQLLQRKLDAGAPLSAQEHYLLSLLRAAPATAATSN